jgi:type II secretory pathway predicted ATPase ExeA
MLHRHASHGEAAARISWTISERALGVITGEVGVGKTVAARAALAALDPSRHITTYLGNPRSGRGAPTTPSSPPWAAPRGSTTPPSSPRPPTHWRSSTPNAAAPPCWSSTRRHLLDHLQLEGNRMLTNHGMDSRSPFATLLIGQPTLRRKIKLGVLAALDQRIAVRYHMTGMTSEETAGYLRHHLALAGRDDTLFSDDAVALIHQTSRGYPRAVNILAIQALLAAVASNKAIVDESSARTAVTEVTTE